MSAFVARLFTVLARVLADNLRSGYRAIATQHDLVHFLDKNSAYVAQKCAYAYCHARMGKLAYDAMQEPLFQNKMEVCRWEGYALILSDLILRLVFFFREEMGDSAPEGEDFVSLYGDVLALHRVPPHRTDWSEHIESFRRRLAAATESLRRGEGTPSIQQTARIGAKALFALVPLGEGLKEFDKDIFFSTVRLGEMQVDAEMRRRCQLSRIWQVPAASVSRARI